MINMIVASSENGVIGKDNTLPWKIPEDLKRFKKLTSGNTIVMGRKTFESIGRPLPNRRNIVLTKNRAWKVKGVEVIHDTRDVFDIEEDVFIIGGEKVYEAFLPWADNLYLTLVKGDYEGDAFFPIDDIPKYYMMKRREEPSQGGYSFIDYKKIIE